MSDKAMDGAEWRPLHGIDKDKLSEGRLQAHHATFAYRSWLASHTTRRVFVCSSASDRCHLTALHNSPSRNARSGSIATDE
jgi:hypothetical protein